MLMTLQSQQYQLGCEMTVQDGVFIVNAYLDEIATGPALREIHIIPVGLDVFTPRTERIFFYYNDDGTYRNTAYKYSVPAELRTLAEETRPNLEHDLVEYVTKMKF